MSRETHCRWHDQSLILQVYVQPRASRDEVAGWHERGWKVRLKAPPVDGAANAQLIRFLAKAFKVAPSAVCLLKGETSRQKTLSIQAPKLLPDWLPRIKD